MNQYEEFGLTDSASPDELQRAHRGMVRLLHPDRFQDPELKRLAEIQLARLNAVYTSLSEPARKPRPTRPASVQWPRDLRERILPWLRGNAAWITATLACVFVIHLALSPTGGSPPLMPAGPTPPAAAQPEPPPPKASRSDPALERLRSQVSDLRRDLARVIVQRDAALSRLAEPPSSAPPVAVPLPSAGPELSPAAPPAPSALRKPPSTALPPTGIAGTWVYAPGPAAKDAGEQYPAEYIELIIAERAAAVFGRYRARYRVADQAISPEVSFRFEGGSDAGRFTWSGNSGASGEIALRRLSGDSLSVDWFARELGRQASLSSGHAVLVRRRE